MNMLLLFGDKIQIFIENIIFNVYHSMEKKGKNLTITKRKWRFFLKK